MTRDKHNTGVVWDLMCGILGIFTSIDLVIKVSMSMLTSRKKMVNQLKWNARRST